MDGCGTFGDTGLEPLSLFQAGRAGGLHAAQAAAAACAAPVLLEPAAAGSGGELLLLMVVMLLISFRILHVSHTGCAAAGTRAVAKAAGSRLGNFMVGAGMPGGMEIGDFTIDRVKTCHEKIQK